MTTFAENVFNVFSRLCERHGFVPAAAMAGKHFASLVKKVTDECYAYVFAHDGRPGDGELVVSVWIAPPHSPDDGLDKLNVGYKVLIASAYDVEDEFFYRCEERIIYLLPILGAFSEVISRAISCQTCRSQRWTAYQNERHAFTALKDMAMTRADAACANALTSAKSVAEEKGSFATLEEACVAAAQSLLRHESLPEDAAAFYDGDAEFLGSGIAGLLYVDALGTLSRTFSCSSWRSSFSPPAEETNRAFGSDG